MSTATADMLSIDRHTSLYGPRRTESAPEYVCCRSDGCTQSWLCETVGRCGLSVPPMATRLDEIATLIRALTYGEMMDLTAALWKMRPEGKEVTEQELPGIWHRWSTK
jgi:hypothetical protein